MTIDEIHVGSVISGPLLPEPVKVLAVVTLGDSIKLIGKGCKTGLVRDPVLTPAQRDRAIAGLAVPDGSSWAARVHRG